MGRTVLLASALVTAGILLHSILSLSVPDFLSSQTYGQSRILCIIISTWIHYFCSVLFWAFFCYSLEIDQLLRPNPSERLGSLCTFLCYGASSLLCLHGLLMLAIPSASQNRCDSKQGLVLLHDVLLYTPLLLALFGSPLLQRRAIAGVPAVLKMQCGVYTCSERFRKRSLCRRLMQISGTFIACWLGNILCDFLLLLVEIWGTSQPPRQLQVAAVTVLVITGILNPMFCSVHSLAFFGWRSSACVSQSSPAAETPSGTGLEGENLTLAEEEHPLLRTQSVESRGKLSFPNILQPMDSCTSVEFSCSALEINAVRLLGTRNSVPAPQAGSKFQPQHSV
ncbi:G-protein coupled receptor 143-like [Mixophyes fleayi]|uniref:G-protein coupled receptor 143-like n=1 Tax=Mixophyes fleayi TaxID=3061075 RepID=UPI003F4DB4B6